MGGVVFSLWLLFTGTAAAVKIQTFTYEYRTGTWCKEVILKIEYRTDATEITYLNEYGDKEITIYQDFIRPHLVFYYNPQGQEVGQVKYDYGQGKVIIQGEVQAKYPLEGPMFENNGSILYLFSRHYPRPAQILKFKFVQGNLSRITDSYQKLLLTKLVGPVPMALKYLASETIQNQGQVQETEKYELYVRDPRLAVFWPHKYYFWYAVKNRWLLQHYGVNQENQPNQYILVSVQEQTRPDPELPSL